MKTKRILNSLWLTVIATLILACSKNESAPDSPPVIQFNSITKITPTSGTIRRDSVVITIGYKDQDGNLGESDTSRIRQVFANQSWSNYRLETLQLVNGAFTPLVTGTTKLPFFPSLSYQKKPVEGTLSFSQAFPYVNGYRLVPLKFRVQIRDRNLNESNMIETDTVRLPVAP